jgi:hypothetical protein
MNILKQILQNLMSINCEDIKTNTPKSYEYKLCKKTPNLMSINCGDIKTNTPKSYEYKL